MIADQVVTTERVDAPSGAELQRALAELAARTASDPLAFTIAAFRWGEGDLAGHTGPLEWQADILGLIRDRLVTIDQAVRLAVASGNGIGKSSLVAFIVLWALCTSPDARVIVTANTAAQLAGKTWPELLRWFRRCVFRNWFEATATSVFSADPDHERTWRADAVTWNETNPEAFAGLHNSGGRIVVIFDEASSIPDIIWQTVEGAMTDADTQIIWGAFGNPTRGSGPFFECFNRFRHRWRHRQIDSRSVRITNKAQLAAWVEDYGEDSDFVRVRVRGVFPRAGSMQFIGSDLVDEAVKREAAAGLYDPLIIGVDVARFGSDQSIICFRKGRDARSIPPIKLRGVDTMQLAARIADEATRYHANGVFIDGTGVGGGVVDRCLHMRVHGVSEVQFAARSDRTNYEVDAARYANKRAEMWGSMKVWLKGGAIPDDRELIADLTGVEYGFTVDNAIILEKKDDMRKRGLASPDFGDALAITFAQPVFVPGSLPGFGSGDHGTKREYDPHDPGSRTRDYDPHC